MSELTSSMQRSALPQKHFNNSQMEKDWGKKKLNITDQIQWNLKKKNITFKMQKTAPQTSFL